MEKLKELMSKRYYKRVKKQDTSWIWMVSLLAVFFISLIVCYGKACLKINGTARSAEAHLQEIELTRYNPPTLKSLIVHPESQDNYFDFILDIADAPVIARSPSQNVSGDDLSSEAKDESSLAKEEAISETNLEPIAKELIDYFFLGITLPSDDLWVNLNSVRESEITSPRLSLTDIGKVLLEADLTLKKDCSRFTDPRTKTGKEYWDNLQRRLNEEGLDTQQLPIGNRFWIVPEEAVVEEDKEHHTVTIVSSKLKVCLEQEYLKLNHNNNQLIASTPQTPKELLTQQICDYTMKQTILPHIQERVNYAQEYAKLRQVYNSLILAEYYKQRYHNGLGLYPKLINQAHIQGLESTQSWNTQDFYQAYVKSAQEGEYTFSQQEYDPYLASMVKKYYFYGGVLISQLRDVLQAKVKTSSSALKALGRVLVKAFTREDKPLQPDLVPVRIDPHSHRWFRGGSVGWSEDRPAREGGADKLTWRGIPVKEVKSLLYPACGNDFPTIQEMLDEFSHIEDIHLVDNASQYSIDAILSAFAWGLKSKLSLVSVSENIEFYPFVSERLLVNSSAKDEEYFLLTFEEKKTSRIIKIHLHKKDYLTLEKVRGLPKGADLTIVKYPGTKGILAKRDNYVFYSRVYSHTRPYGYVYITAAHYPRDQFIKDRLLAVDFLLDSSPFSLIHRDMAPPVDIDASFIGSFSYVVCKKVEAGGSVGWDEGRSAHGGGDKQAIDIARIYRDSEKAEEDLQNELVRFDGQRLDAMTVNYVESIPNTKAYRVNIGVPTVTGIKETEFLVLENDDGTITVAIYTITALIDEKMNEMTDYMVRLTPDGSIQSGLIENIRAKLGEFLATRPGEVITSVGETVFVPYLEDIPQEKVKDILDAEPVANYMLTQAQILGGNLTLGGRVYAISSNIRESFYGSEYNTILRDISKAFRLSTFTHEIFHHIFDKKISNNPELLGRLIAYLQETHEDAWNRITQVPAYSYIDRIESEDEKNELKAEEITARLLGFFSECNMVPTVDGTYMDSFSDEVLGENPITPHDVDFFIELGLLPAWMSPNKLGYAGPADKVLTAKYKKLLDDRIAEDSDSSGQVEFADPSGYEKREVLFDKVFPVSAKRREQNQALSSIMKSIKEYFEKFNSPWIEINTLLDTAQHFVYIGKDKDIVGGAISLRAVVRNSLDAIGIRWWDQEAKSKEYNGAVRVKMLRRNDKLIIEVTDNGRGIQKEVLEKLFIDVLEESEKKKYPKELGLFGKGGRDVFNVYGRLWVAEIGGQIEIDTYHHKTGAHKLIYRSDSDITIDEEESERKEQGTSTKFTLRGFFAKGEALEPNGHSPKTPAEPEDKNTGKMSPAGIDFKEIMPTVK